WLRGLDQTRAIAPPGRGAARPAAPELLSLLRESGVVETAAPRLLTAGGSAPSEPLIVRAMRCLADDAGERHASFFARSEEIAYLANVLAAGCSFELRRMRPIEARRAAIATASLGLEVAVGPRAKDPLAAAVRTLH